MKRRIFSVLIALALCLSLLPATALAAEDSGTCGDNLTWTLSNDGTLTITGSGAMADYESNSGMPWKDSKNSIRNVVIEEGVTSIGKYAFYECTELTSVEIPESVTTIGAYAFTLCKKLNSITLPSGLTSIEASVFSHCYALKSITIPETVKVIKTQAFGRSGLTEVKIPGGVTIETFAFYKCDSLVKVEIPKNVKSIEKNAIYESSKAEIYYEGTTEEWANLIGSKNIGVESNMVHTSDSDTTFQVTIVGGGDGFSGGGTYSEGAEVTVSAGTMEGKAFAGWTVTGVSLSDEDLAKPNLTFTMPANAVTLTATWAEAVAQVGETAYTTVQAAFDAIGSGSGRVYLLKDVTVDQPIKMSQGSVTLESEKKTLTGTGLSTLNVTGGTLTLENVTVENNTGSGWGINAPSALPAPPPNITIGDTATVSGSSGGISQAAGSLTVNGTVKGTGPSGKGISAINTTLTINEGAVISGGSGDNAAGISQDGGTLTVNGGTISGHVGLSVEASLGNLTVRLTGGTFIGTTGNAIEAPDNVTLGDLLGEGLALINVTTGEAVNLTEQYTGSGTFTVGCAHASVESVTSSGPDENGVVTVTATCDQCKEEVTLGTLTMVGSGQTITYGDPDPTFEVQAEGLTVTGYTWSGDGLGLDKTSSTITPHVLGTGELNYTCKVTFTVPGGTGSANLKFTLTVNQLDISTVEWTVKIDPEKAAYNGQPQKLSSIAVDNGRDFFGAGQFDIQFVDASGSEAAEQTDAGTYKIKLTGKDVLKGTITLDDPLFVIEPATSSIAWPEGTAEEKLTYTGEAAKLKTKPAVTVTGMTSYDGEAVTYSYATAADGPYTKGLPKDAGEYFVKAAVPEQKNYAYAVTANTLTLQIAKATPTLTSPTPKDLAYNGKPQALVTAAEATFGEVQYSLTGEDGSWSKEIPTGKNAGEYTVWYKVDETDNYKGVAAASVKAEIGKATVTAAPQDLLVKNNLEKAYTLDLKPFLPALPQGQEYGTLTYEVTETEIHQEAYIDAGTVMLEGTVLTVPVKAAEKTEENLVAAIKVAIKSENFLDIQQIVTVSCTDKTPVTITGVTAAGWTYDGKPHPGYTGTPDTGEYTGTFDVAYRDKDGNKLPAAPKNAGAYTVTFSVPDGADYVGSKNLSFKVEQAEVTVRADNQTAYVGDAKPELTWRVVSGLASGETLKTNPTPACDPDMSKAGTYPITISGGAVPGGGNYKAEIVYQNGTLTVSEKAAPPKPVDPKPPVDPDELEVKLEVKEGFTEVPPALRALEHLNTPEKLTQVMRTAVTRTGVPSGNTAVYDVSLMVSTDGGRTWVPATSANFPAGGLTVTLPYPAGTDSTYRFTVVHMFTTTAFGKTPGDTESPAVTNTEQGLRFTVRGLSPISVGWKAKTTGTGGSSSGGSSSGGGSRPMSSVTVERAEHGKVTSDRSSAGSGSSVTLTVQPDRGYRLESLTVTDSRGNKLQLTDKGGGKYAFTMSGGNVTVKAVFAPLADSGACDGGAACPSRAFTDLKSGAWYHEAVDFVLEQGWMGGYGNGLFGPDNRLSRAQFAQILYNKEGRPAGAGSAPFTDVAPGAWCAPAVAWAAERGIAGGYGGGLFGPDDPITREQLAVMLWRYAGSPAAPGGELSFMDAERIGAHAREAICWAVESGVMSGKSGGVLDPKGLATRAQTAQMLKNFLENG